MKNPIMYIDGYKLDHRRQYPEGTEFVYSNLTARMSRNSDIQNIVAFGFQYFIKKYLLEEFNENFFKRDASEIREYYTRRTNNYLGENNVGVEHIMELHKLGYLPIEIKAIPEGTLVPIKVPFLTIINTDPKFFWVTNYLETILSNILWKGITSATTAFTYRKKFEEYVKKTGYDKNFVKFQGHDFSFRGMSGVEDAVMSGAGHLLSFCGTDTIPAIDFLEEYYNANSDNELVGVSVPATEHSVMSMNGKDSEIELFRKLITEVYPSGIVSVVSDTWDFWKVISEYLPLLKEDVLNREGRLVIRPDSGDPVDIICGEKIELINDDYDYKSFLMDAKQTLKEIVYNETPHGEYGVSSISRLFSYRGEYYKVTYEPDWNRYDKQYYYIDDYGLNTTEEKVTPTPQELGAYEVLWNIFGGTINKDGYKELHPSIGMIYGDSITLQRQKDILDKLASKGFSSSNLVFGIGSYTYEYVTRDTFGMAMKATWGMCNGEPRELFKDPVTDSGFKKSLKGLIKVYKDSEGKLCAKDQCTPEEESETLLETIFKDGVLIKETSLKEIRDRIDSNF